MQTVIDQHNFVLIQRNPAPAGVKPVHAGTLQRQQGMQTAQRMEDVIGIKAGEERSRDLLESPVAAQPHTPVPLQQKHRNPPVGVVASSFKLGNHLLHQLAILNQTIHADQAIDRHPHLAAQALERRPQEIAAGGAYTGITTTMRGRLLRWGSASPLARRAVSSA